MTRLELYEQLKEHDWYHACSDDINVWRQGFADAIRLQLELQARLFPFPFWSISASIHGFILEKAVKVGTNTYRLEPWVNDMHIASLTRDCLITQAEHDAIQAWFHQ